MAGAAALAAAGLLAVAAWFVVPSWSPAVVLETWPWPQTAIRAALTEERRWPGAGVPALQDWGKRSIERSVALAPYLASPDAEIAHLALAAFAGQPGMRKPPGVDRALTRYLDDSDPVLRLQAVRAMSDTGSIPALEAQRADPDPDVAEQVAKTIEWLRIMQKEDAAGAAK